MLAIKTNMRNYTTGEFGLLSWQEYSLGVFLFFAFMSIAILNIVLLKGFYNLRNFTFVRNSKAVISLLGTDLVNALILTPTLMSWFLTPPPNDYMMCVVKSVPYKLTNFTSLLSMTAFCVYRLLAIKKVVRGQLTAHNTRYGFTIVGVWALSMICVAIPYVLWNNFGHVVSDCRRSLFSDIKKVLTFFALLYDIPFITMNLCLVIMIILYKRYKAKVFVWVEIPSSQHPSTSNLVTKSTTATTTESCHSLKQLAVHMKGVQDPNVDCFSKAPSIENNLDIHTPHGDMFADESTDGSGDKMNVRACANLATPDTVASPPTRNMIHPDIHHKHENNFAKEEVRVPSINTQAEVRMPKENTNEFVNSARFQVNESNESTQGHFENTQVVTELKQFLITMGVLVAVYDLTVLPFLFDLNIGAVNPNFVVPNILNSLCFLNSFCNPVVYLVRMKMMRCELKRMASFFYEKLPCCRLRGQLRR